MADQREQTAAAKMHMETVELGRLHPHPDNDYSVDAAELADLTESIRHDGMAQLPLVRPHGDGYQIIAGHRRVESYRTLAEEDPLGFGAIPVNVLDDCDDERALVLLDATNLMTRQLTPLERAKRFERLWKVVPSLRRKSPELKGVRTSQVIADIVTRETGQSISRASIDRALAAGRKAKEVDALVDGYGDALIKEWAAEFRNKDGFTPDVVKQIAAREGSVQKALWADYQRDGMTPKQLAKSMERKARKTDADVEHALDQVIQILRDVSAWNKTDGALIDSYRVNYIRNQLDKLGHMRD